MAYKPHRISLEKKHVTISLPENIINRIDKLANEVKTNRSEVIKELLNYSLANEEKIFSYICPNCKSPIRIDEKYCPYCPAKFRKK